MSRVVDLGRAAQIKEDRRGLKSYLQQFESCRLLQPLLWNNDELATNCEYPKCCLHEMQDARGLGGRIKGPTELGLMFTQELVLHRIVSTAYSSTILKKNKN